MVFKAMNLAVERMDLHSLHRPTPNVSNAAPSPAHKSLHELTQQVDRYKDLATHWKRESQKLDGLVKSAVAKLDSKSKAKEALKAEVKAARQEADTWHQRYKQLAESGLADDTNTHRLNRKISDLEARLSEKNREMSELQDSSQGLSKDLQKAQKALKKAQDAIEAKDSELAAAQRALKQAQDTADQSAQQIQNFMSERPIVQSRLQEGAAALRERNQLLAKLKSSEEACARLQSEVTTLRSDLGSQKRQAQQDVQSAMDRFHTATQQVSAKTNQVGQCIDMLARSEQVLMTCSTLFASKKESSALGAALTETTSAIQQFIKRTKAG
jgi:chromosome segregation ATPase